MTGRKNTNDTKFLQPGPQTVPLNGIKDRLKINKCYEKSQFLITSLVRWNGVQQWSISEKLWPKHAIPHSVSEWGDTNLQPVKKSDFFNEISNYILNILIRGDTEISFLKNNIDYTKNPWITE